MAMKFIIRNAKPVEYAAIGQLMSEVYSQLDGFPKPSEQPSYYNMLANVGGFAQKTGTEILVGATEDEILTGAVVYFREMLHYGSGGKATQETNTSGFRLLAVNSAYRGLGVGKQLTLACLAKAKRTWQ
jgi:hypothetical protein